MSYWSVTPHSIGSNTSQGNCQPEHERRIVREQGRIMNKFERTSCTCQKCQAACRAMPGYLVPSDLPNFDPKDLAQSEGAVVIHNGVQKNVPTVVPKTNERGECVFFANGRCTVHDHSPFGCRMFSMCDDTDDREQLRHIGLEQIFENQEYLETLATLDATTTPRSERVERLQKLLQIIERKSKRKKSPK